MANVNTKVVKVDPDKFRAELRRRGLNMTTLSRELGYCDSYVSTCIRQGTIGLPAANILKLKYNMDVEVMQPEAVEKPKEEKPQEPEGDTDLKKEIATLTATLKALEDDFRNYRVAMLGYMKKFENHKKYGHF